MRSYPGKFRPQLCSFIYRPHPFRGKGSLTPCEDGLQLVGMRGGEEERPALILGVLFLLVSASLIKLKLSITLNWMTLGGFLFLLGIFAFITQKVRRQETLILWQATGSFHSEADDLVEIIVKDGLQRRYLTFQFDGPESADFLTECRKLRGKRVSV